MPNQAVISGEKEAQTLQETAAAPNNIQVNVAYGLPQSFASYSQTCPYLYFPYLW